VSAGVVVVAMVKSSYRSSEHNSPASIRGLPHILHWRPNLRNTDSHPSTALASAVAVAAAVPESVPESGRHHSSADNLSA